MSQLLLSVMLPKKGQIAGPKLMEHMVDTVLYLSGESNNYRLLKGHKIDSVQ